jgi:hypothetical protein
MTSRKNGNKVLRGRAIREAREEGVSEERYQAKQTNSLRARGPCGQREKGDRYV